MNSTLEAQVQWLMDRARISDLLFGFARALDTKDFAAYVDNYAADGFIELPQPDGGSFVLRRSDMLEKVPASLAKYAATHHMSTNHQIDVNGDTATSRAYLQAVHVGATPMEHWDAGGWYDCRHVRSSDGWKFSHVKLTAVWLTGSPSNFDV